ncbi:hypothetical protein V1264_005114 [Littorina saxatilis]|uniref:Uncharacterized protein n=1 Tax=Littorina saxatilis TaxID=31220 RepID=A0AAN9G5L3_9CAEN
MTVCVFTATGVYNFTVVTGLFDIGRGWWLTQPRTYSRYLVYLLQVLKLDVNLVVFIEPKGANFVRSVRQGREHRTVIVESSLNDLPCYQDLQRVTDIMASVEFQTDNDNWKQGKVEATSPLYNIVTNSKTDWVQRAVDLNPFHTPYFIWLDAGLTHGHPDMFPPDGVWHPRHLLAVPDRVTYVALRLMDDLRDVTHRLHKIDTAPMAGGLFAGGTRAMLRYCHLHSQAWREMLDNNMVDDDQTTFTLAYFKDTHNFNPVLGHFFDLIKPWT